jgi:hypothetical protein
LFRNFLNLKISDFLFSLFFFFSFQKISSKKNNTKEILVYYFWFEKREKEEKKGRACGPQESQPARASQIWK